MLLTLGLSAKLQDKMQNLFCKGDKWQKTMWIFKNLEGSCLLLLIQLSYFTWWCSRHFYKEKISHHLQRLKYSFIPKKPKYFLFLLTGHTFPLAYCLFLSCFVFHWFIYWNQFHKILWTTAPKCSVVFNLFLWQSKLLSFIFQV